jgi:hypothetical protein
VSRSNALDEESVTCKRHYRQYNIVHSGSL